MCDGPSNLVFNFKHPPGGNSFTERGPASDPTESWSGVWHTQNESVGPSARALLWIGISFFILGLSVELLTLRPLLVMEVDSFNLSFVLLLSETSVHFPKLLRSWFGGCCSVCWFVLDKLTLCVASCICWEMHLDFGGVELSSILLHSFWGVTGLDANCDCFVLLLDLSFDCFSVSVILFNVLWSVESVFLEDEVPAINSLSGPCDWRFFLCSSSESELFLWTFFSDVRDEVAALEFEVLSLSSDFEWALDFLWTASATGELFLLDSESPAFKWDRSDFECWVLLSDSDDREQSVGFESLWDLEWVDDLESFCELE